MLSYDFQRRLSQVLLLGVFLLFTPYLGAQILWFVPPASNPTQQGFVRITNPGSGPVNVQFFGIDDAGRASQGSAAFTLAPFESKQFNSSDIEFGNSKKGLQGSLGTGVGNWRLILSASSPVQATALIRTTTGFLTSVQDADPNKVGLSVFFILPTVNPGENPNQVSILRIVNPNNEPVSILINGFDDNGVRSPSQGFVSLTLGPRQATQLFSNELENGAPDKGLVGSLGDGVGKWRLTVSANLPVKVLNLLFDPNGFISELPSEGIELMEAGFFSCADFDGAMVFSQEDEPQYLGFFGSDFAIDSINNGFGSFGSSFSSTSMRNSFSQYGSSFSSFSALNNFALNPPIVVKNGKNIGHITTNQFKNGVPLSAIDAACDFFKSRRDAW
ncbi:MAG: hypothetical protein U1A22_05620 [Xanthomonadaceae bacterium]|nr:hypothetical protein [Xanthomonadaceae bacterium]